MASKSTDVELDVNLNYQADRDLWDDYSDPEDFILTVNGEIYGKPYDEEPQSHFSQRLILGKFKFHIVQVSKVITHNENLAAVFDAYQETLDAGSVVFNLSTGEYSPMIQKMFPDECDFFTGDILILDRLTIFPIARGQRLGLAVLHKIIEDWSRGCSFVVIKPFPLQFESSSNKSEDRDQLELEKFSSSGKTAFKKLRNYYQHLGFKRIGRTEFYVLCPNEPFCLAKDLGFSGIISATKEHLRSFMAASKISAGNLIE